MVPLFIIETGTGIPQIGERQAPIATEALGSSWHRSLNEHRLDPASGEEPRVLTAPELAVNRAAVEELIALSREDNDRLYGAVGRVGYCVLFTSADGVVVDTRGNAAQADDFRRWGIWKGGVWAEGVEGTNGIGTCIAEQRPVTVHRSQHFRARHASLSCCGAPVFDPEGKLLAVVDVSSYQPAVSDRSHALAAALTIETARSIEERLFRHTFQRAWIVAIATPSGERIFLALDEDQRIVGADRYARAALGLKIRLGDTSLWHFFERAPEAFGRRAEAPVLLVRIGERHSWPSVVTPPQKGAIPRGRRNVVLSGRERSVVALIGEGLSNKQIARRLEVSPETVKSHLVKVFGKLAVERRAQAVARAKDLGLL
jgi:transcriptional regulator of acetoin/glycerol metabolism